MYSYTRAEFLRRKMLRVCHPSKGWALICLRTAYHQGVNSVESVLLGSCSCGYGSAGFCSFSWAKIKMRLGACGVFLTIGKLLVIR